MDIFQELKRVVDNEYTMKAHTGFLPEEALDQIPFTKIDRWMLMTLGEYIKHKEHRHFVLVAEENKISNRLDKLEKEMAVSIDRTLKLITEVEKLKKITDSR